MATGGGRSWRMLGPSGPEPRAHALLTSLSLLTVRSWPAPWLSVRLTILDSNPINLTTECKRNGSGPFLDGRHKSKCLWYVIKEKPGIPWDLRRLPHFCQRSLRIISPCCSQFSHPVRDWGDGSSQVRSLLISSTSPRVAPTTSCRTEPTSLHSAPPFCSHFGFLCPTCHWHVFCPVSSLGFYLLLNSVKVTTWFCQSRIP